MSHVNCIYITQVHHIIIVFQFLILWNPTVSDDPPHISPSIQNPWNSFSLLEKMATNRFGLLGLQQKLSFLNGACVSCCSPSVSYANAATSSVPHLSRKGNKTPRRLVLGFGVSFWAQFMSMDGKVGGGAKSFIASARQTGDSPVEQV